MQAAGARRRPPLDVTTSQMEKIILADETAKGMLEAAKGGLKLARGEVIGREKGIELAERNERHRLQHEKGLMPIRQLQAHVDALEAQLAQVRAQQAQIFAAEVWPRNDPFDAGVPGATPGQHTFLSVPHVLSGPVLPIEQPAPLPPSTAKRTSGEPLSEDEKYDLLWTLDHGVFSRQEMRKGRNLSDADLYACGGDFRRGGQPTNDPDVLAAIRAGLRGEGPSREWILARMRELGRSRLVTVPQTSDGRPAIDASGNFTPAA